MKTKDKLFNFYGLLQAQAYDRRYLPIWGPSRTGIIEVIRGHETWLSIIHQIPLIPLSVPSPYFE